MCQAIMRVRGVHGAGYDDPMEDRARIGEQSAYARPARGLTWSAPFPAMETAMNTDFPRRTLGRQGPTVSAIGLGCVGMSDFYGPSEACTTPAVLGHALDIGLIFIEPADTYGVGEQERPLSEVVEIGREHVRT